MEMKKNIIIVMSQKYKIVHNQLIHVTNLGDIRR